MDTVSLFEEPEVRAGGSWQALSQRHKYMFVLRKERFMPWSEGYGNLDIVFAQIQDGLRRSHYRFSSDAEIVKFLTERYFIEVLVLMCMFA